MQCDLKRNRRGYSGRGRTHFISTIRNGGMNYSSYVDAELVEMTRKTSPLSDKREDTYIGASPWADSGAPLQQSSLSGYVFQDSGHAPVVDCLELTSKTHVQTPVSRRIISLFIQGRKRVS